MQPKRVLVVDIDNTLFDWLAMWSSAFGALLRGVSATSGLPREELLPEFRRVFRKHGTVEYSFVLEEHNLLRRRFKGRILGEVFKEAIDAYRAERDRLLVPYPGVVQTLRTLKEGGVAMAAYTESLQYFGGLRINRLGLDGIIDALFCPPDHSLLRDESFLHSKYPVEHFRLAKTVSKNTPIGELKPNPKLLLDIVNSLSASPAEAVYVGDSLDRDIRMAQDAGVLDVHAAYGANQNRVAYALLEKVSHWSDEEIEKARKRALDPSGAIKPTISLTRFQDLQEVVEFAHSNAH